MAHRNNIVCLVTCFTLLVIFHCALFTSAQTLKRYDDIQQWALREEKIFEMSKTRIKRLKQELSELEKFVDDYEKTTSRHLSGIQDPELKELIKTDEEIRSNIVASNALLTYRMTHRLSTMMTRMQRVVLSKDPDVNKLKEMLGAFTDINDHPNHTLEEVGPAFGYYSEWLPNEDDLEGALDSMVVLYDVYNPDVLGANEFAALLSAGTTKPVEINAYHATKFSLKAFYHGYYGNALDWANYATDRLDKWRDYSISNQLVHYMRKFMEKSHNDEFDKPPSYFPDVISYLNFFSNMINETKTWTKRKTEVHQLQTLGLDNSLGNEESDENERNFQLSTSSYYKLCQKARLLFLKNDTVTQVPSKLTCKLDGKINPYFYLSPLKTEIISESPRILQFYNVLSPLELELALEEVSEQEFKSAYQLKEFPDELGTRKPHLKTVMEAVVDKETLKKGDNAEVLRVAARKLEYLTGFKILENGYGTLYPGEKFNFVGFKASEFVGGGYEAFVRRKKNGEKMEFGGGVQLYLQASAEGGEVVFGGVETIEKIAKPVTGGVLFWENIGSDLNKPVDILLGSCPVVEGHKIVLSKTFSYSLDRFAYF